MLLPLLSGCLLFVEPPPRCPDTCGAYGCDPLGICLTECHVDDECAAGSVCSWDNTCETQCVAEECPGHLVCDSDEASCLDQCVTRYDCRDDWLCTNKECVPPCDEDDCPHGLTCDGLGAECNDTCYSDSQCRDGWACCSGSLSSTIGCEYGLCFRD